jgi:hypothetical protein
MVGDPDTGRGLVETVRSAWAWERTVSRTGRLLISLAVMAPVILVALVVGGGRTGLAIGTIVATFINTVVQNEFLSSPLKKLVPQASGAQKPPTRTD